MPIDIQSEPERSLPPTRSKPRPRNPDNLFQRGDVWWIRYNAGGKKIRATLGTTSLKEAKRLRNQILGKRSAAAKFGIEEQQQLAPCKTFAQVAALWLKARAADESLAPATRRLVEQITRNHLIPAFGSMLMSAITVEDIEHFIAHLRSRRLKRKTIALYYQYLGTLIRQAIRRGWYTGPNPTDRVERPPTGGPGRDIVLSDQQARSFLSQLDRALAEYKAQRPRSRLGRRLYYKCAIALKTGLRWGEVHGLAWADIELDGQPPTMRLVRSYQGRLKTDSSAEIIPLSSEVVALLRRWKAEQAKPPGTPDNAERASSEEKTEARWVFPNIYGRPLQRCSDQEAVLIKQAAAAAELTDTITPHVFRHTFGTWVYEHTTDIKRTQRLLRHSSLSATMRYVHDRRELVSVVDALPILTTERHLKVV